MSVKVLIDHSISPTGNAVSTRQFIHQNVSASVAELERAFFGWSRCRNFKVASAAPKKVKAKHFKCPFLHQEPGPTEHDPAPQHRDSVHE